MSKQVSVTYDITIPDGWELDSTQPVTIDKGEVALSDGMAVQCNHSASAGKYFRLKRASVDTAKR